MRLKLYWLQKLRAFRVKGLPKKQKLIAAATSENKDATTSNTSQHAAQENHMSGIRSSSYLGASSKKAKHKPHIKLSQVVASFGCGSTAPLRIRRERNRPKVYSEEEDNSQGPPLEAFGSMNRACSHKGRHRQQHDEDDDFFKDCCLDPHTLTTKRWVGACRCIHDADSVGKGSTRSDEALLSKKLQKVLTNNEKVETKMTLSNQNQAQNNSVKSRVLNPSIEPSAYTEKETHFVPNAKKLPSFTRVEGSMSDRIVVDSWKRSNAEMKTLERWSSASVRDCWVLKGTSTPADYKLDNFIGSVTSSLKERPNGTTYDESFRITSFERRRQRPQSMTSVSTLSSYDFDRASHGGSYDATNMPFNSTHSGIGWQQANNMEDGSKEHSMRRQGVPSRPSSTTLDPNVSVVSYTLSDCESDDEEEHSLLHTVSYARAWLNRNTQKDEDIDDEYEDDDDDNDCLIDLEANAKVWATAWGLSSSDAMHSSIKSYGGSSLTKRDSMGSSQRSQRELHAAALKRKYHNKFAAKQQAIVVSSHYEDDMNTFVFPHMSDYEDDRGTNPLMMFNYRESSSNIEKADSGRHIRGDGIQGYRSFAVEKRSRNPYEDFRDSMVEMVLQKQMHKSSDLEELLQSFLCLNSLEHHELIVQAFSEVWEKVFGSISGFHKRP